MPIDLLQVHADLISIPSVNPMGRDVTGDEYLEHRVTAYLEQLFRTQGVRWQRQTVSPLRDNIVARIDGSTPPEHGGKIVMLEAHQDTVPVDGMIIPPWTPTRRDGRVYGRGSCDIKGGMASMLWAFSRLAEERPNDMPTVIMACSVNEEHGFGGAQDMVRLWDAVHASTSLIPRTPDEVIVAEPTMLNVVVAHKGAVRWRCRTNGRAAHSSQPHLGENAVYHMARVLPVLEKYAREVVGTLSDHPLVGPPTLNVGLIAGGVSVNTVPDRCSIDIDRRVLPGEDPHAARQHVIDYLQANVPPGTPVDHEAPFLAGSGLPDTINRALAQKLAGVTKNFGGGELIGVPFGTDAPAFAGAGAPTVVCGPGSIAQAHTSDEWIAIDQLEAAAEVYYQFARQP